MEKKPLSEQPTISALIIAKDEAEMLQACLDCLHWCDEVLVLDSGSLDATAEIADRFGARVIRFKHPSFSSLREEILKHAKSEWVFYIDADERVLPKLAKEIRVHIETGTAAAIQMDRANIFFGQPVSYGGWGEEQVIRVFMNSELQGWKGEIHESPVFTGTVATVKTPLVHLTHRNTRSGLLKSAAWTWLEAQALFDSKIPAVTFWTLVRKGFMEFFRRAIVKQGYKDGMTGLIEATIQAWNRIIVYIQVWELQQQPSLSEKYAKIENEIAQSWKKS